jgi:hypothetical protein
MANRKIVEDYLCDGQREFETLRKPAATVVPIPPGDSNN